MTIWPNYSSNLPTLKDNGVYAPHNMVSDLQYVLTLPAEEDIMNAQGEEKVAGYTLENIEL
jgi:hypothetical protein